MKKLIVCIGGIHGSGKTSLCNYLNQQQGFPVYKQSKLVQMVSGLDRQEVFRNLRSYLEPAADCLVNSLDQSQQSICLIDCHYAINSRKALRLGDEKAETAYIPDLEHRFLNRLQIHKCTLKLVFLDTSPKIAYLRCLQRESTIPGFENSLSGLIQQRTAELIHFHQLSTIMAIPPSNSRIINNDGEFWASYPDITQFINDCC